MVDQIRLGRLAEKYPRLNIEMEIFGYLQTIIFNKYNEEKIEDAFLKLEEILKNSPNGKNWNEIKYLESTIKKL